ncbi:MAG TPA: PRC-barrel domain-containing protein [Steroidobacteraceae bacterium]|jgi:sporulation protein YlmC with PRC-barrel domain|nr:PRC-barrel domain-containing protein [Steroidobacteraceae bacterium]
MPTASGHTIAIRARKVIGTPVRNNDGKLIGNIEDIVLDKTSDRIMFAIVGLGGFLRVKEKFHPLPWSTLRFEEALDSYVVPFTREQLLAAPADTLQELTRGDGAAAFSDRAHEYYDEMSRSPH